MLNFRITTIAVMLLCCAGLCFADMNKVGDHNIGAAAGFVTGYGLSYRQWIGNYGFQLTAAPFHKKTDYDSRTVVSVGATALRTFKESKLVNLFGYFGPHLFYYKETYRIGLPVYDPAEERQYKEETSVDLSEVLFVGGGPGIDFHFLRISFSLMFGFAAHYEFEEKTRGVHFTGETALYYSF